jgi:hypothetical protein
MQTFLPFPSFELSAKALDMRRLGKQRVECKQLIRSLTEPDYGWRNHPASKMWKGNVQGLAAYGYEICKEWRRRGYKDTLLEWFDERRNAVGDPPLPHWLTEEFCRAHQSNLIRKDSGYYSPMFPGVLADLPYIWPV